MNKIKRTNNLKKKMISIFIVVVTCVTLSVPNTSMVEAASLESSATSSAGGYTLYVRKSSGSKELGKLYIKKTTADDGKTVAHYGMFTASVKCTTSKITVGNNGSNRVTSDSKSLNSGDVTSKTVIVIYSTKSAATSSKTYGKIYIEY